MLHILPVYLETWDDKLGKKMMNDEVKKEERERGREEARKRGRAEKE